MTIPVILFTFRGYAFDSGDISFGEAETRDIQINRNGDINTVQIRKESATFTLRGATDVDLIKFEAERANNVINLINGSAIGEDIAILGKTLFSALLYSVQPSAPISVAGNTIYEQITLEYRSQKWS